MTEIFESDGPGDWRQVPLATVADVRVSSVNKVTRESEQLVRLCNYIDVYNHDYITDNLQFMQATATTAEIERFGLRLGDVIITKDSETPDDISISAVVDYAAPDLVCGYHLALIRPQPQEVDSTFLAKQLKHYRLARYFGQRANGLTRYGLPNAVVANTPLWLPELPTQKAIAAILRLVDEAIAKTEAVIAKLKKVRAGMLHDLLTRGLDEHGQFRDPVAHPEQFQDSSLGRIPCAWELKTLSSLCVHIGSGITPRGGQDVYTSSGILFIRSQNVTFEGLLLDDVAYIPEHIHLGMLRSETFPHDVLFNITGASIGRCCPMLEGLGKANVNQHVCLLRISDADARDAKYLALVLASSIGQRQLDALNTMGNRQGLNYQQLGCFVIPWPKTQERRLIASKITTIEDQVRTEGAECEKLKFVKSGLMSDLLTGCVRVPEGIAVTG